MREYTSLLELVRSEPLISENIKATYHDVWQPKYKNVNVRYVYKTTIIEGLNIYMTALCKENDVILIRQKSLMCKMLIDARNLQKIIQLEMYLKK